MIKVLIFVFLFSPGLFSFAQTFSYQSYPKNYFRWPVDAQIGIAANFGELRPNHYHMGLDVRTDQKQNRPVLAAAEGYIAKIKIEPYGFGRCIYINHPNGLTTLYAHLNDFMPALEIYLKNEQYRLQQWQVYLDIPPGLFPVKQGDEIAESGNTGGSQGPHTHFEIRDTKTDKCLNPLLFGLPIPDNIAPDVIRLAVYDRSISTYDQSPKFYPLRKINGVFSPAGGKIIAPSSKVSFAITAYDRYTGSSNQNGIYGAALFDDDELISRFEIDSISYDETRTLNGHIDYRLRSSGGPFVQHISPLPGFPELIYLEVQNEGIVAFADSSAHRIKISVTDANENTSSILFSLLPPAIAVLKKQSAGAHQKFIPNYLNVFENEHLRFYLPENAIYDTVNFTYKEIAAGDGHNIYQLHTAAVPLQTYFPVSIRETFSDADTGRIVMKRSYGSKTDFKKAVYKRGWFTASFREFGNYQLLIDAVPPIVSSGGFRSGVNAAKLSRIVFTVTDNSEEIESFNAYLDGNWLRFTNDKGRNFIYTFDEHCGPGKHQLKVEAVDLAGNKTERVFEFVR